MHLPFLLFLSLIITLRSGKTFCISPPFRGGGGSPFNFGIGKEGADRFVVVDAADGFGEDGCNREDFDFAVQGALGDRD